MITKIIIAGGVAVGLALAVPKVAQITATTVAVNSSPPMIKNMMDASRDPVRSAKINADFAYMEKLRELCFAPKGDPLSEACKQFQAENPAR